jgi:hypothetical protein
MTCKVRVADLAFDAQRILALLQAQFDEWQDERNFLWQYTCLPSGPSRQWLLDSARGGARRR